MSENKCKITHEAVGMQCKMNYICRRKKGNGSLLESRNYERAVKTRIKRFAIGIEK